MRLTALCFFKQKWAGNIHTGKYRYVPKVTLKAMNIVRAEYARQEKVMALLRHPYLTKVFILYSLNSVKCNFKKLLYNFAPAGRIVRACN